MTNKLKLMFAVISKDMAGQTIQLFEKRKQAKEFITAWELENL